jgi:tripartite-type tricarboxylate transporter receptor subunit TctC
MTVLFRVRSLAAAVLLAVVAPCWALDSLNITIPAVPGSALDTAGRELGHAITLTGGAITVRYENVPGAAGVIGLARFANSAKGDPSAILLGDSAMADGLVRNPSGVTLSLVTAIARLTLESQAGGEWRGVFAAPGITSAQRDELLRAVEKATHTTHWRDILGTLKWHEAWLAGDAFGTFVAAQTRGSERR